MLNLPLFNKIGFRITWKILYIGFCSSGTFGRQFNGKDIIDYAVEQLGCDDNAYIYRLAITNENETQEIEQLLYRLSLQENADDSIEKRKIRATIMYVRLQEKETDYIKGLIELMDLWVELDYPEDIPFCIVQGRGNYLSPQEYYTEQNYNAVFCGVKRWLAQEIAALRKME